MKRSFLIACFLYPGIGGYAQLHFGPSIAVQAFAPIYKEAIIPKDISASPRIGYTAGLALDYRANKMFSFYTELSYSRKGKFLSGGIKDRFRNIATYHYLDFPFLTRLTLHQMTSKGVFTWFVLAGGTVDYWLAGNGILKSFELDESAIDKINYQIKFKPKTNNGFDKEFTIYLDEPNRVQVGLLLGAGLEVPINDRQHIYLDLRYNFRQSWLARDQHVDVGLGEYFEDFRTMEHCLSINAAYMFDYNFGENRKGKTAKAKTIKTKKIQSGETPKRININRIKKN